MRANIYKTKIYLIFISILLLSGSACVKEKLNFDKLSKQVEFNPDIYTPLAKGTFSIRDLTRNSDDSVIRFKGDTIYLVLKQDSVFTFNVKDYFKLPDQGSNIYTITSPDFDYIVPFDQQVSYTRNEVLELSFDGNMQVDSAYLNSGLLRLEVSSNFNTNGSLEITSPSITFNNQPFDTIYYFIRESGDYTFVHDVPLTNSKIFVDNANPNNPKVHFNFTVTINALADEVIEANSYANISLSIIEQNEFVAIFGYAGDSIFSNDTIIETNFETLTGLSGEFAITNPQICFNINHSFGFPLGFDMKITGLFDDIAQVDLEPGVQKIGSAVSYLNPFYQQQLAFNRYNIPNIDDFIRFPPPREIAYSLSLQANPDGHSENQQFILGTSDMILGIDVEVPLEFRANLEFRDTVPINFGDLGELTENDNFYVEHARLHYRFRNEFPLNIDGYVILYDSLAQVTYDTLKLNELSNSVFLSAAPVDAQGLTIMNQVREVPGMISLEKKVADNLIKKANKFIVVAKISTSNYPDVRSIKLLDKYSLRYKFNLEAKFYYKGYLE